MSYYCYASFPKSPSVCSYNSNITPDIDQLTFFRAVKINYDKNYSDGDIVGAKITVGDCSYYRGDIDMKKPSMANCCTFLIFYKDKKVSIKLFATSLQICGMPSKDERTANLIVDLIVDVIDTSKNNIFLLKSSLKDGSAIPKCFKESIEKDSYIKGDSMEFLQHIVKHSGNYLSNEYELHACRPSMLNYNYKIPFSISQKRFCSLFNDRRNWIIFSNNSKMAMVKLEYEDATLSVTLSVTMENGSVTQSGACEHSQHQKVHELFMTLIMENYKNLLIEPKGEEIVYETK